MSTKSAMSFSETIKFLNVAFKIDLVPLLMGHTGIGKTECIEQYAQTHNMDAIILHVAQLEPSDFIGLYEKTGDGRTRNCPPNWLPYKEPQKKEKNSQNLEKLAKVIHDTGFINPNGGVIFLDEVNRGHEDIRQALYQLINKKKIHTYALPNTYHIVAAANPFDSYEVYDFDAALRNRFAWVFFKPTFDETKKYLEDKYGKNPIMSWLSTDKSLVEYGDDVKIDGMCMSPRIVEKAIQLYKEVENEGAIFIRKCLETIIQAEKVQSFISYLEEIKHINYKDVLAGKKKEKIKELLEAKRMDILSTITTDLADYYSDKTNLKDSEVKNTTDYLMEIPAELDTVFLDALKNYDAKGCITSNDYFRKNLKGKLGQYKKLF